MKSKTKKKIKCKRMTRRQALHHLKASLRTAKKMRRTRMTRKILWILAAIQIAGMDGKSYSSLSIWTLNYPSPEPTIQTTCRRPLKFQSKQLMLLEKLRLPLASQFSSLKT